MARFQDPFWGYTLTHPDAWNARTKLGVTVLAADIDALDQIVDVNEQAAHMLVRGEFNGKREPIAPRWNEHLTKLSLMMGAKKIGSAPFSMGGANGFEAEIQLPKTVNRRVWVGILAWETVILHLMVSHRKDERDSFEPLVTKAIASLQFLPRVEEIEPNADDLPALPQYTAIPSRDLVPDARDDEDWRAYDGERELGALQQFYYRELPRFGWEISEFIPFPNQVDVNFARLRIHKAGRTATLGILPFGEKNPTGKVVVKFER